MSFDIWYYILTMGTQPPIPRRLNTMAITWTEHITTEHDFVPNVHGIERMTEAHARGETVAHCSSCSGSKSYIERGQVVRGNRECFTRTWTAYQGLVLGSFRREERGMSDVYADVL